MTDEAVAKRILKFLRQMNSDEDDAAILQHAVSRDWLSADGRPTKAGRSLVKSFDDLDSVAHYLH